MGDRKDVERLVNTEAYRRALTRDDLERMHLPLEFWRVKVDGIYEDSQPVILRYLHRLDEMMHRPAGLLLFGQNGVGKTGIAAIVAKEARSRGYTAYFTPVWELREDMRNRVMFDADMLSTDRCRQVDLLVLDGLREEDAKAPFLGARELEDLIVSRGSKGKPTFLTTRLKFSELRNSYGSLLESTKSVLVPLEIKGDNRRLEQGSALAEDVLGRKRSV